MCLDLKNDTKSLLKQQHISAVPYVSTEAEVNWIDLFVDVAMACRGVEVASMSMYIM